MRTLFYEQSTKNPDKGPEDEPGMPHFQRADGRYIDYEPSEELFEVLPSMDEEELRGLGLQPWDDEHIVWLFPVEWFEHIPEGKEVWHAITEEWKEFNEEAHCKEARYGAMPFGIVLEGEEPPIRESSLVRIDE